MCPHFQALQLSMVTGLFLCSTAYPALAALVGTTLPDYQGRFLEGASGTVGEAKEAGLPDITAKMTYMHFRSYSVSSGALSHTTINTNIDMDSDGYQVAGTISFNASNSNSIYGNSTTVQPASYTVNYLIKAY